MPRNTSPTASTNRKPREKSYRWSDADTKAFLEWWLNNREYVNSHAMSDWRNKAKEELFKDPEHVDLTVKKITNKHDGLIKGYKAVKREYCETTGGGKNETDATLDETLVKAFKWYNELEEIMGDKLNVGRPIAPIDSLDPGPQGKRRRNESTGLAGRANFSPAGPPTDDDGEEPQASATARQKRRKILKKLAQTAKARGSTRKANPAVTAANEEMDALINVNERIQMEKIKSEERTEAKRIEADAQRAKERQKHTEQIVREVGGIIKDVVQTVSSMYFKSQAVQVQPAPTTQRLSSPRRSPSLSS